MQPTVSTKNPAQSYLALDPLLKLEAVKSVTGLSRSSVYKKIADADFPQPVRLGPRSVAWRQSDIAGWLSSRPVGVRGGQA